MAKELHLREAECEYTAPARWVHWIRMAAIIALTITGFYLASVYVAPSVSGEPVLFLNARMRMWHLIFGCVLICATIFKTYLFFLDWRKPEVYERVSYKDVLSLKIWVEQIKYYLFLGKHPKLTGVYNPIQFVAYVGLYVLIALVSLTGLILYVHVYHDGLGGALYGIMRWFETLFGGLANVRALHHWLMWAFLLFVPVHLYMVVFNSIKGREGALDTMLSGLKFKRKH